MGLAHSPVDSRPRCFEHGCNGRAFANSENYKRHLRERSRSGKVECSLCYKDFTRKSNMEKHISDGKCAMVKILDPDIEVAQPSFVDGSSTLDMAMGYDFNVDQAAASLLPSSAAQQGVLPGASLNTVHSPVCVWCQGVIQ